MATQPQKSTEKVAEKVATPTAEQTASQPGSQTVHTGTSGQPTNAPKKYGPPPTPEQIAKTIKENGGSKSAAIRNLTAKGVSRSEIAHMLQIRYQHVRNVAITPLSQKAVQPVAQETSKAA